MSIFFFLQIGDFFSSKRGHVHECDVLITKKKYKKKIRRYEFVKKKFIKSSESSKLKVLELKF